MQRIEPALFGDEPLNWQAAIPTAGQVNPPGAIVDVDQDGLPDTWELANGLDPQIASAGNGSLGDADGDGANNLYEYIAGTNPSNSADYLYFTQASVTNLTCRLDFATRLGRTYAVESASSLSPTNAWTTLTNGLVGTGGTMT